MATFSVDITDVVFAGSRTGYKDITITGMPAGGVTVSLTGSNPTYFTYTNNPESKGTNVYRVSTKSTNDSSDDFTRDATFKIVNTSDSTDYVTVSLKQCCSYGQDGCFSQNISNYSDIYSAPIDSPLDYSAYVFFPYSLSDSTARVEIYVDGTVKKVYTTKSWISTVEESTYTDTGFKRLLISCINNYDGPRYGQVQLNSNNSAITIYQNGYPSSTSGCTQSISFTKSGGTESIVLKTSSSSTSLRKEYLNGFTSPTVNKIDNNNYSVTIGTNNTGSDLTGLVWFGDDGYTYIGHTIINQSAEDTPSPTLTVDPTSLTYPASGGARVLDVTYSGTLTTSEFPSWLTYQTVNVDSTHRSYTITASKNSSTSSRNFNLELSNGTDTITVPVTQSGAEAASLTISPTGASVGSGAGTTTVTVTSTGIDTVEYSIAEGWVSLKTQSSNVYTFSYTANTSSSQRSCIITFYGGGLSKSFVINQAAGAISVSPKSQNVDNTSGTIQVTVTGSSNITYSISGSWLTYQSKSDNVYTFAYTQNSTSSQRTATVTFSASGMTDGIFTLTQEGASAPASLSISPTSNSVSSSFGSVQITVTSSGISDIQYSISDSWITYGSKNGNVYTFNYEAKTSTGQRTGTITFSGGGLSKTYTLTQEDVSTDSITVNKEIMSIVGGGGYFRNELTVTYAGTVTVSSSSWITGQSSFPSRGTYNYSFSVSDNTEEGSGGTLELRKGFIKFTGDNGTSCRVDVYQGGKTYGKRPVCIPDYTLGTYPAKGGQKYLVIDYYNELTYTGVPSWITLNIVDGGTGATESIDDHSPVIFSVEVGKNESSKPMEATMVFQGGDSLSLKKSSITVYQEIGFPPYKPGSLKAYPKKLRYYGEGGEIKVSFTNRPEGSIGYEIAYIDGSGWLSVRDSGPYKYVTATKNSGIRRRARIKFYDVNDIGNYVIVPVIQGNIDGYDSIWMDDLYYPENRGLEYYLYRIVDHNSNEELFRGYSVIFKEGVSGIDIPRLVEGYLASYLLGSRTSDWVDMVDSYRTVDILYMSGGDIVDGTFKYCNDWSRFERRYDYTRSLNDPINCKGCDNMIIPFCVYYDDEATFSIVETDKNGNVNTTTLSKPSTPFAMGINSFYDTKKLEYKQDDEVIFSYDMNHCGPGAFIYRNRFGGWDSFLIEGNIIKTDNYTKLNWRRKGEYNHSYSINTLKYNIDEKVTDSVNIDTTYQAYTGWLSDEEAERLVFHLLSSPTVYFQNLDKENQLFNTEYYDYFPVRLTASSAEYKKFRNGKKMVNYLITFEKCNIEKVRN